MKKARSADAREWSYLLGLMQQQRTPSKQWLGCRGLRQICEVSLDPSWKRAGAGLVLGGGVPFASNSTNRLPQTSTWDRRGAADFAWRWTCCARFVLSHRYGSGSLCGALFL